MDQVCNQSEDEQSVDDLVEDIESQVERGSDLKQALGNIFQQYAKDVSERKG